jgi:hypothetical protein
MAAQGVIQLTAEALEIVEQQRQVIEANWDDVCDEAGLKAAQRALVRRVFPR